MSERAHTVPDPPGEGSSRRLVVVVGLLVAVVYGPLIAGGGWVVDDWGIVSVAARGDLASTLSHWITHTPAKRPVYALVLALTGHLFGTQAAAYLLFNLALWLTAVAVIGLQLRHHLGDRSAWLFVILSTVPAMTSTTVFSGATMIATSLATLCWALSLAAQRAWLGGARRWALVGSWLAILVGLLTYEIILPLLVLTVALAVVDETREGSLGSVLGRVARAAVPVVAVVGVVLLFQALVVPLYAPDTAKVNLRGWQNLLIGLSWFSTMAVEVPLLVMGSAVAAVRSWSLPLAAALVVAAGWSLRSVPGRRRGTGGAFLVALVVALVSASLLFLLSGYRPLTSGYANRTLASSCLLLNLVIAWWLDRCFTRRGWPLAVVIAILCCASMIAQRDAVLAATRIQATIVDDLRLRLEGVAEVTLLACVPAHPPGNVNDEAVFTTPWDLRHALLLTTGAEEVVALPFTANEVVSGRLATGQGRVRYAPSWEVDLSRGVLYYELDSSGRSRLLRLNDEAAVAETLAAVARNGTNAHEPLLRERWRRWLEALGRRLLGVPERPW